MKYLVLVAVVLGISHAQAGDKVGNGGGLWACVSPDQQISKGTLVDLYEARTEFGLILITSAESNPLNIVKERETYLRSNFNLYLREWSLALSEVLEKMRLVEAELEKVDDALFRMRPLPSTCAGTWNYIQFANFTHLNQVLIRKDIWNHEAIPALDKAALIWHEAIYKWLRATYGDRDSVRARQIVGLMFAQLTPQELARGIDEVLRQTNPNPPVPPVPPAPQPAPTTMSVCIMQNRMNRMWTLDYGSSLANARAKVTQTCKSSEDGFHCDENSIRCDSFLSNAPADIMFTINNRVTGQSFLGEGRSKIEAEGKALKACSDAVGPHEAIHCSYY